MNTKFKFSEKTVNTLLYVGAAVLILAILGLSIFAFASRKDKNPTPTPTTSTTPTTTKKTPTTTAKPQIEVPISTAKPQNQDTPTVAEPKYTTPVDGILNKDYDSELLVYSVTMNDYRVHLGVDLAASVGSPVYAMADGKIVTVSEDYLMGTTVKIEHDGGLVSVYSNLQSTLPEGIVEGASVEGGQLIGGVGETAIIEQCDDAHLHLEVFKNGKNVDPLEYITVKSAADRGGDSATE
ncbi:MAG: M23 family metallopeptidase [Clostridia bacterium]|nr:M23 family metallopeptidase [Clostridia bacterium]